MWKARRRVGLEGGCLREAHLRIVGIDFDTFAFLMRAHFLGKKPGFRDGEVFGFSGRDPSFP
jgi:hypothetical protein